MKYECMNKMIGQHAFNGEKTLLFCSWIIYLLVFPSPARTASEPAGGLWANLKLGESPCENGLLVFTGSSKSSLQLHLPLRYFS